MSSRQWDNSDCVPSDDKDYIKRENFRHSYTDNQRFMLCLTRLFFDVSYTTVTQLFNQVFAEDLRSKGFPEGLRSNVIQKQLYELESRKGSYQYFGYLFRMSLRDLRGRYFEQRNIIKDAASEIGIQLKPRIKPSRSRKAKKPSGLRVAYQPQSSPSVLEGQQSDEADSNDEWLARNLRDVKSAGDEPSTAVPKHQTNHQLADTPSVPKNSEIVSHDIFFQQILQGNRALLKQQKDILGFRILRRDTLLWRYYTAKSGSELRAGLFRGCLIIPPPAEGDQLRRYVEDHLLRKKTYSPFISLYAGPRPVFSRALQADTDTSARIAIIDFTILEASLKRRFPNSRQSIYVVKNIVKYFGLNKALNDFGWLAWGTVEDAVICDWPVTILQDLSKDGIGLSEVLQLDLLCSSKDKSILPARLTKMAPNMDRETGRHIAKFLEHMAPYFRLKDTTFDQFKEVIALKIATAWRFKGYQNRGYKYIDYMSGIFGISNLPRTSLSIEKQEDDYEQDLLDQQLAATSLEFRIDADSEKIFHTTRLSGQGLFREVDNNHSTFDNFTLEILKNAEDLTPTPQPEKYMYRPGMKDSSSSDSETIDLTPDNQQDKLNGEEQKTEGNEDEEEEEDDDITILDLTGRHTSILSIRTLSLEPSGVK